MKARVLWRRSIVNKRFGFAEHCRTAAVEEHLVGVGNVFFVLETTEEVKVGEMPALQLHLLHDNSDASELNLKLWQPAHS
jgi:hypothetical protein